MQNHIEFVRKNRIKAEKCYEFSYSMEKSKYYCDTIRIFNYNENGEPSKVITKKKDSSDEWIIEELSQQCTVDEHNRLIEYRDDNMIKTYEYNASGLVARSYVQYNGEKKKTVNDEILYDSQNRLLMETRRVEKVRTFLYEYDNSGLLKFQYRLDRNLSFDRKTMYIQSESGQVNEEKILNPENQIVDRNRFDYDPQGKRIRTRRFAFETFPINITLIRYEFWDR